MSRMSAEDAIRLYGEAKGNRTPHEDDWRKAAAYCLPQQYASWQTEGRPINPASATSTVRRTVYDSTGARSLPKYVAILERLATPAAMKWHTLTASDESLRRHKRVRDYFEQLRDLMFRTRYHPRARFRIASSEVYQSLGVYGNGPIYIGERKATSVSRDPGIKYIACPIRDTFVIVDDDGEVYGVFRRFWLNVRQFRLKFPNVAMPTTMAAEAKKPAPIENEYFEFVHFVVVRDEKSYDPSAIDQRRHPWSGSYICCSSKEYVGDETGYASMPYKVPRTASVPGDVYGFSPAVTALASMGGASAMKKINLKQGNKAVDPPLLAHDESVMNGEVDLRPGAINYGGVSRDGKLLIQPLRGGDFRVGEVLLQDERRDIEDSFFVTLFQILTETPEMTATEVMERVAEKAALLSPTMGRIQSEFLGPTIEREIDVLNELGLLPEMPPELVEAQGEYEVVYTSPLAKSMYAEEVSGFMRSVETSLNIAQATQDMSALDHYNFDVAIPEMADYMAVPSRWMASLDDIKAKREARTQQAETQQMIDAAPAAASVAKTVQGGAAR